MEEIRIQSPKKTSELLSKAFENYSPSDSGEFDAYLAAINEPVYLPWRKAMFRKPPQGMKAEEAWILASIFRKSNSIKSPINTPDGNKFTYQKLTKFDEILHNIDLQLGGKFLVTKHNSEERQKFLTRGVIEEAIASSQLEGASTTRKYAKAMIAENKKPKSKSEWMIYNNYKTMSSIDEEYKDQPLSMPMLLEMHAQLTEHTMDSDEEEGRLRQPNDEINVVYENKIAYRTPPMDFVNEQLKELIKFANDNGKFVHPVIKACILHFWIGFLHPFTDGNGRLARAIFYWYLLKSDYWAVAYIPVSMVLKSAKKQYTYAYIYSEQDQNDLTYFLDFHLRKLQQSLDDFDGYVRKQQAENKIIEDSLKDKVKINDRQKQLLYYLLSNPDANSTELSHRTMNGIARNTSRTDIKILVQEGLLNAELDGKVKRYTPSDKLLALVNKKSKSKRKRVKPIKREEAATILQQSLFEASGL
jgi:Fic family protein